MIFTWTVYGKISQITKSNGTTISYTYDASGNRISKVVAKSSPASSDTTWYVRDAQGNVMSVYAGGIDSVNSGHLSQTELHLYGSSRLGILRTSVDVAAAPNYNDTTMPLLNKGYAFIFARGNKLFELSNHLGNVLVTVSDKKLGYSSNDSTVDYFNPQVVSAQDYHPFGMLQPGRNYNATAYRYGFNGQERCDEVKGEGSSYTAKFWYDPRLGRRWNLDPKPMNGVSQYSVFNGSPIIMNDPLGDTAKLNGDSKSIDDFIKKVSSLTGNTYALNNKGQLMRTNKNLNTKSSKKVSAYFSQFMETLITSNRTIEYNFTSSADPLNKKILFDSYFRSTLDMGDYDKVKNRSVLAGLLAHALSEYYNGPKTNYRTEANYAPAHNVATVVESAIVFEMNGFKPGTYQTRTNPSYVDKDRGTFNFIFTYGSTYVRFSTTISADDKNTGEIIGDVK